MPAHLRPSAPTAASALLCGDPSRALAIAQRVLVKPRMSNHHRGLWGYWGETAAGAELTVQATGIGGPSAAVVIGELAELGLRRAIRIGTCSAGPVPSAGSGIVVAEAIGLDGTTRALGYEPGAGIRPDPPLTAALGAASGMPAGQVISRDLHEDPDDGLVGGTEPPAVGDLQSAAVLGVSAQLGIEAAATLAVARSAGRRLDDEPLEAILLRLASAAAEALAAT